MDVLSELRILQAEKELRERHSKQLLALTADFPQQRQVVTCQEPLMAVRCSRRSGKSYGAGIKMFHAAYEFPGCDIVYVMHSLSQARHVMFRKILMKIDEELELGCNFNKQLLEVTVPTGSVIRLIGLDKDESQANKVLGNKLKLVIIDEAAFYTQDIKSMIEEVFLPALADERGQLILISSANPQRTSGYFYDITERIDTDPKKEVGFYCMRWKWQDNPFAKQQVQDFIDSLCIRNPNYKSSRSYKVQWEDEWIPDDTSLVYKYNSHINDTDRLPQGIKFNFITSTDLGYEDPTAISVCAWAPGHPVLYVVKSRKYQKADLTLVASLLKKEIDTWKPIVNLIDAAAKQSVEEMRRRHGIALTAAPKFGVSGMQAKLKTDFIELLNDDFLSGRIKILPDAECLKDEALKLSWDSHELGRGNRKEASNRDNHALDSLLYSWKYAYHYLTSITPAQVYSKDEQTNRSVRVALQQERNRRNKGFWDRDWRPGRGYSGKGFLQ